MNAGNGAIPAALVRPEPAVVEAIRRFFREDPSRMTRMAARRFGLNEQAIVEAMIGEWPIAGLRDGVFRELMNELSALGPAKIIVRNHAAVIETIGTFGGFSESGPFFNVRTDSLEMHIQPDEVAAVYSVERAATPAAPAAYSLQLFDRRGEAAFKVFLWDRSGLVPPERVEAFRALTERLSTVPDAPVERPAPLPPPPSLPPRAAAAAFLAGPAADAQGGDASVVEPSHVSVPIPDGAIPGAAAAASKLLGTATTGEARDPLPTPWQFKAIRVGVRVAAILAVLSVLLLLAGLFVLPMFWRHYEHHPRLIDAPKLVQTGANGVDLPLNIGLVGNEREIFRALLDAGWDPADPGTFTLGNRYVRDILLTRPYPKLELDPRILFGRPQDLAFVRETGGTRRVVRLWKSDEYGLVGRTLWLGTVWSDHAVKSAGTGGADKAAPARRLDPGIDAARDALIADLSQSLRLTEVLRVTGVGPTLSGQSVNDEPYYTDGELTVGLVPTGSGRHDRPPTVRESPFLVRIKDSIWSELAPLVAGDSSP